MPEKTKSTRDFQNFLPGHSRPFFPSARMRKPMTRWFHPGILLGTGLDIVKSRLIGSQIDTRELQPVGEFEEPLSEKLKKPTTYKMKGGEFYFDFIADTGDGWNSTYSVASLLSRDKLLFEDNYRASEGKRELPRGEFVIIGGDIIYPTANDQEYRNRFFRPFDHAWDWRRVDSRLLGKSKGKNQKKNQTDTSGGAGREEGWLPGHDVFIDPTRHRPLYALPGNHDWYDSLGSFGKRFCNILKPRRIGAWHTDQHRSYFALELPENWFILAVDLAMDYSLNNSQFNYFAGVIRKMKANARVILVSAEPDFVYDSVKTPALHYRLEAIEEMLNDFANPSLAPGARPKVWLNLSGDVHNYQRYERISPEQIEVRLDQVLAQPEFKKWRERRQDILERIRRQYYPRQKIVCGGGGAFLHPTHASMENRVKVIPDPAAGSGRETDERKSEIPAEDLYEARAHYPGKDESRRISLRAMLQFMPRNLKFTAILGVAYTLLGWTLKSFMLKLKTALANPAPLDWWPLLADLPLPFWVVLTALVVGLGLWAGKTWSAYILGGLHGLFQALIIFGGFIGWYLLLSGFIDNPFLFQFTLSLVQFVFAGPAGAALLGLFFWIYLTFLSYPLAFNNALAHAAVETHKSLLRIRIEKGGRLTVYAIGIPRVTAYSVPEPEEVEEGVNEILERLKGKGWREAPADTDESEPPLYPEKIDYFLIEAPLVIDPARKT